jgi:actin related protein 2/3 complex, subunit 1A/1B
MTEKFFFGGNVAPITCHAWNHDRSQIAISPNNNEVHIYQQEGNDWKLIHKFEQHDLRVMAIDWGTKTNRIVTCSVDRNAYVWTLVDGKEWKPALVLLRINRAATCVRWSPEENKFACGSGARLISVCYFEEENDWWVSKHIKKPIRSTVTSLDWHPNNVLLVAGSTDYKVRVFSAYIKDIEPQPAPTAWGKKMPLGQLMGEFKNSTSGGGWIHSVSFSSDGNKICWVGHDSAINIVDITIGPNVFKLRTEFLPFLSCIWISPTAFVCAGHSNIPLIYSFDGSNIIFNGKLDESQKREASGISAMRHFQSLDRNSRLENSDTHLDCIHQNAISWVAIYAGDKGKAQKISTSGLDGQLVLWNLNTLTRQMQNLKL